MTLEEKIHELEMRRIELFDKRPRTQAEDREKEKVTDALVQILQQQAKPLFDELVEVGIRIKSVWDFVNTSDKYPEAIPVLIKHLSKSYHHRTKEGIVRALAVKEAKGVANRAVMDEYWRLPKENPEIDPDEQWIFHYRWAFGNTMKVIVLERDLDDLIEIVLDKSNGHSRNSFVEALAKLKSPKVIEVLNKLVKDKSKLVSQAAQKALDRKAKIMERKKKSS